MEEGQKILHNAPDMPSVPKLRVRLTLLALLIFAVWC
jgi:hypothetical protein